MSPDIKWSIHIRPLCRKLRMRELTDPLRFLMRIFCKILQYCARIRDTYCLQKILFVPYTFALPLIGADSFFLPRKSCTNHESRKYFPQEVCVCVWEFLAKSFICLHHLVGDRCEGKLINFEGLI